MILPRVAVTGGTGFLGRALVTELLKRGSFVRALVRKPDADLQSLKVEQVVGDLMDVGALSRLVQGVDCVFHVAAIAGIWGPWNTYFQTNTLGTHNVTLQCHYHGVPRLVFTGSPSVTFTGADQIFENESAPYAKNWLCHYPHSKALAEQYVLNAHGKHGLATCVLRPHLIWGPGDRHLIPRLMQRSKAGKLVRVGDGRNLIDTIHIDNAVLGHIQAANSLAKNCAHGGKAYYLSQGEPVNCWEWIGEILLRSGMTPPKRSISFPVAWHLGHGLELLHGALKLRGEPRMTRFLAAQLAKSHYFDISAARRDFGYQPLRTIEDGMREFVRTA